MALTIPYFIKHIFASSASGSHITNPIPDASTGTARASWVDGFPPLTFTDPNAGGSLPYGADYNGVLYALSANDQWTQAGGRFPFDATFATAIGGYQPGMIVQLNNGISEVLCTATNNTTDPNSSMTGWAPYAGSIAGAGQYAVDSGTLNHYVVALNPPITTYATGQRFVMIASSTNTNTASPTLDAGGGQKALFRNDGTLIRYHDVAAGTAYPVIYDGTQFRILAPLPSQYLGATGENAPANPTGTANTSLRMMGVGIVVSPQSSGNILAMISGRAEFSGGSTGCTVALVYGVYSGSLPGNGVSVASVSGTVLGNPLTVGVTEAPFSVQSVIVGLSLAFNSSYWFDLAINTVTAGSADVVDLNLSAVEV